ncbi:hypothetical protein [Pikeienuella sp. HZG-20]|uniref:hypothetical protein n=1 Tax=Paludibacillus litoralis TaxID=3133267 RepID=UPI0030EC6DB1
MLKLFKTSPLFAPADGGRGGFTPKQAGTQRALNSLAKAIEREAKADGRAEAARRRAIAETFGAWLEMEEDQDLVRRVFIGLEIAASKASRKRIASHPLRPAGVDAPVEERLAEIAAAKAEAEAEREAMEAREAEDARGRARKAHASADDNGSAPDDSADAPA